MNKKIIVIISLALISISPFAGASVVLSENEAIEESFYIEPSFNHTVMVEYASMTTCGPCVTASRQLYDIYTSGDLDFNYVTLVADEYNKNVYARIKEFGVTGVPHVFFDGEYLDIVGSQQSETPYRNAIMQCGERDVPDIDIDVDVVLKNSGILKITVTVYNNELEAYNGRLITYIVEKESRWNDAGGNSYHFAALDIPLDSPVVMSKGQTKETHTFSKTWYGFLYGFDDITKDNIEVIATVFDSDTGYAVESASGIPIAGSTNLHTLSFSVLKLFNEKLLKQFPLLQKLI